MFAYGTRGACSWLRQRQQQVDPPDQPTEHLAHAARLVERLHLHEQLVDAHVQVTAAAAVVRVHGPARRHCSAGSPSRPPQCMWSDSGANAAPASGVGAKTVPRPVETSRTAAADRVELVDEADRAALLQRDLAQRAEVRADLAGGGALEAGVEGRAGREQERHVGLGRERLRRVRLAGARRALEQDAATGLAAQVLGEVTVGQEQVERVHDLVADGVDPDDVGQSDVQLLGPVDHVRRAHPDGQRDQGGGDDGDQEDDVQEVSAGRCPGSGRGPPGCRTGSAARAGTRGCRGRPPWSSAACGAGASRCLPTSAVRVSSTLNRSRPAISDPPVAGRSAVDTEPPPSGTALGRRAVVAARAPYPTRVRSPTPRDDAGRSLGRPNKSGRTT